MWRAIPAATRRAWRASGRRSICARSIVSQAETGPTSPRTPYAAGDTHFGYRTVQVDEKQDMVKSVFMAVADKYDIMNDAMSGGMHRVWKDEFVRMLGPRPSVKTDTKFLDVAGGTGDIAFRISDVLADSLAVPPQTPEVTVCDINPEMLRVGQARAEAAGRAAPDAPVKLDWVEGNAEKLPFEDNSFDAYTIAFGIRNVTHVDVALQEALRVLKPGGRFMCLEFGHVRNPLIAQAYDAFSFHVIPSLGTAIAGDRESYQYLVESIRRFPQQDVFAQMVADTGFQHVTSTDFTFGVCAVTSGFKPAQ